MTEPADPIAIEFLTFEDICQIHDRGLAQFGDGVPGILDEHTVRSAAAQPEAGMSRQYFHRFPAGMAAAYLYYLTNQQGFLNGNKRTAVGAALEFLARNGYGLRATNRELYEFTVRVAGEDVEGDSQSILAEVEDWIARRLAPLQGLYDLAREASRIQARLSAVARKSPRLHARLHEIQRELSDRFAVVTLPPAGAVIGVNAGGLVFQQLAQNVWGWQPLRAGISYKDDDGRVIGP